MIESIDMYLHGDKDSNCEIADAMGLKGDAYGLFKYALCEVIVTVDVNIETGETNITHVDGRKLEEVRA